jgi:outer membrane protein assembly factor BamB
LFKVDRYWHVKLTGSFESPPALSARHVIVADSYANVTALNLENGHQLWSAPLGSRLRGRPLTILSHVFVATDDYVFALNIADGSESWKSPVTEQVTALSANAEAIAVASSGGGVRFLSAQSGEYIAEQPTRGTVTGTIGWSDSGAVFADDIGTLYSLDLENGTRKAVEGLLQPITAGLEVAVGWVLMGHGDGSWSKISNTLQESSLVTYPPIDHGQVSSFVALAFRHDNKSIYLLDERGALHCRRLEDGVSVWTAEVINGAMANAPVILQGRVFITTTHGQCVVLDAESGSVVRSISLESPGRAYCDGSEENVFFTGSEGSVEAFAAR